MIIQKKAYAKINLYLKILDKLPNGYHNIFTVMQKISLCDDIKINIEPAVEKNINIICYDTHEQGSWNVPADKTNTAYRAAELFLEYAGAGFSRPDIDLPLGIEIEITKRIPSQAGLGGGSSDAGSVLLGLNEYFDFILPESVLIEIAAKIGADVPFFVKNANCAICEGVGEIVTPVCVDLPGLFCVIVKPVYNIPTKRAYEDWDKFAHKNGRTESSAPAIKINGVIRNIHNDFSALVFSQNKNIKDIKNLLLDSGAAAAELSGGGSALFGIFDNSETALKCKNFALKTPEIEFCDVFEWVV